MKLLALIVGLVLIIIPSPVLCADIEGRIWIAPSGETPLSATISTSCEKGGGGHAFVGRHGLYRISGLPANRNCGLTVHYQNMNSNPINVYTGNVRNSANLEVRIHSGQLLLIRR